MDQESLLEAVAGDLFVYVLNGDLPRDDIGEIAKPPDAPEQYAEFERLVDLHFIIQTEVLSFVDSLQDRLRSIKTETKSEPETQRGGIEGRIDWGATYRERFTTSPGNRALYVTETQQEQYNIPENIVLKAIVERIEQSLEDVERYLNPNRSWVSETWVGNPRRRERFVTTVQRNAHLQRIPEPGPDDPTDRMVNRAAHSRKGLYREAASLLKKRREYDSGSPDAIESLLRDTLISPDKRQTLFELFVLFRVLDALRTEHSSVIGVPTYHTIMSGRDAVATFDGTAGLRVYYDSTPDDPNISFRAFEPGSPNSRSDRAYEEARSVADTYFTDTQIQNHTKRPDVLVTSTAEDQDEPDYLIIEVKDSTQQSRVREGITEIVEYLSYLRRGSEYEHSPDEFGNGLNGLLVIQDEIGDEFDPAPLAEQASKKLPVRIVQARHLEEVLPSLIWRVFVDKSWGNTD